MMQDDLMMLADQCDSARFGSRKLDALIEVQLRRWEAYEAGVSDEQRSHWKPVGTKGEVIDDQGYTRYHPPTYTMSVDAALLLVPNYFSCETTQSAAPASSSDLRFTCCRLWDWRPSSLAIDPDNEWKAEGNRPLPLNICAAALRARSSVSSNDRGDAT